MAVASMDSLDSLHTEDVTDFIAGIADQDVKNILVDIRVEGDERGMEMEGMSGDEHQCYPN